MDINKIGVYLVNRVQ